LTLSFEEFNESHTGEALSAQLLAVFADFGIKDKVAALVSDNAGNANLSIRLTAHALATPTRPVVALRCIPHILNLVVRAGFEVLTGPLQKLKFMVSKLRSSPKDLATLQSYCEGNEETYNKPQTDTETRWNSTYALIKSMISMEKSLFQMRDKLDLSLSDSEWHALKDLITLLKPFLEATNILSGSKYCSLSQAGFISDILCDHLRDNLQMKHVGIESMLEKLETYQNSIKDQALLPSFFDPRCYGKLSNNQVKLSLKSITPLLKKEDPKRVQKEVSFFEKAFQDDDTTFSKEYPELQAYMNSPKCRWEDDPLDWWARNEKAFPNIAQLARNYLAMLASTVPSEQAFSAAGNTVTDHRNRLASNTIESLMVTQGRLRFLRERKTE